MMFQLIQREYDPTFPGQYKFKLSMQFTTGNITQLMTMINSLFECQARKIE